MISDRLSGRVESDAADDLTLQGSPSPSARESHGGRKDAAARVTDASVRRLLLKLSNTDHRVIETLATVRIATGAQLRALHWADTDSGKRLARHHLARLTELRILARLDRRIGGIRAGSDGHTYTLDVAGLRLVNDANTSRPRRPVTPGDRYLDHALAVTDCYVALRQLTESAALDLLGFEAEPACWRTFPGAGGQSLTIKPDAFVVLADTSWEHRWFLEIDRSTEHLPTIIRKARTYLDYWQSGTEQHHHDVFPKVLWITPTERRTRQLVTALATLDSSDWQLFQVGTADSFADLILRDAADEAKP